MDKKKTLLTLSALALGSVAYNLLKPIRSKVDAVSPFELDRYLGQWYEIARLDFIWEKNLKNVTAVYQKNEDRSVRVENSGTHVRTGQRKVSVGKAKFVGSTDSGSLKVSFFGPFYSGYHIVQLDDNYRHALVFGDNLDYLWILSRSTEIPVSVRDRYLQFAQVHGYDIDKLVWTPHDKDASVDQSPS